MHRSVYSRVFMPPIVLFCAMVCSLVGISEPAQSQGKSLLMQATKVADAADLGLEQDEDFWLPDEFERGYIFWMSSEELLMGHAVGSKPKSNTEARKIGWFRHNLKTGKEEFLDKLSALYNQTGGEPGSVLSPDGKWLLWTGDAKNPKQGAEEPVYVQCAVAARLDGSSCVRWLNTTAGYWANDSFHWLSFETSDTNFPGYSLVVVYNADRPGAVKKIRLREGSPLKGESDVQGHLVQTPLAILSDKQAVTNSWIFRWPRSSTELPGYTAKLYNTYWTYKVDLSKHGTIVQSHFFRLPADAWVRECRFSPSGERIAWILEFQADKTNPKATTGLWISRMDGSDLHEIGHMDAVPHAEIFDPFYAYALRWLPDGKRVSFVYKNAIWVVSAD